MQFDELEHLVDLVARSGVSEVTIRTETRRVTVRKALPYTAPLIGTTYVSTPDGAMAVTDTQTGMEESSAPKTREITSPMVGIFHHAEPPIGLGGQVERGQVVGVVETMKLMNDIRAEISGVVSEVLIEAGMAVEYGQPLFTVVQ